MLYHKIRRFSGRADYSVDMRNIFDSLALWQIQYSDYSVDMRKSIPEQEMWPSDLFGGYGCCVRALQRHLSEQPESPVAARKTTHRRYGRRSSDPERTMPRRVPNSAARSRRSASTGEKVHIPSMGLDALISYKPWFGARPRITLDEEFPPELAQGATPH
jgi:hypothetical protein